MNRMLLALLITWVLSPNAARANPQVFLGDYSGFQASTGALNTIDFETLPNGQPSHAVVPITILFNYDVQGAHFSTPIGNPFIGGNSISGFALETSVSPTDHTWIMGQLSQPASAIGIFYSGFTSLAAFDANRQQIAFGQYGLGGPGNFLGIVSDVPIASLIVDRGGFVESIDSFVFSTVPEPASVCLVTGLAACRLLRARRWQHARR